MPADDSAAPQPDPRIPVQTVRAGACGVGSNRSEPPYGLTIGYAFSAHHRDRETRDTGLERRATISSRTPGTGLPSVLTPP